MSVTRREFLEGLFAASVAAGVPVFEYVESRGVKLSESERLSLTDIVTQTLRSRQKELADNVTRSNALFRSLANAGVVKE